MVRLPQSHWHTNKKNNIAKTITEWKLLKIEYRLSKIECVLRTLEIHICIYVFTYFYHWCLKSNSFWCSYETNKTRRSIMKASEFIFQPIGFSTMFCLCIHMRAIHILECDLLCVWVIKYLYVYLSIYLTVWHAWHVKIVSNPWQKDETISNNLHQ